MKKFLIALLVLLGTALSISPVSRADELSGLGTSFQLQGQLIGVIKGADFNSTADQTFYTKSSSFIIRRITVTNASTSLTTAVGGIYGQANKAGSAVVANTQVYSALTTAIKYVDLTLTAGVGSNIASNRTLYFSLTTPQGSAATADIYVFGDSLD